MSSHEFARWMAFASIEPIGDARQDWRLARLLSLMATIWRNTRKRPQPFGWQDFMVDFWERPIAPGESQNTQAAQNRIAHNIEIIKTMLAGKKKT